MIPTNMGPVPYLYAMPVPNTWYLVITWYVVPGTWHLAPGACNFVHGICYLVTPSMKPKCVIGFLTQTLLQTKVNTNACVLPLHTW